MATVKPKFRPSTVDGKEGTLFYRIIHNRRSHRIRTGYKLFPSEWDERSESILIPPGSDEGRKNYLAVLQDRVAGDTDRLNRIILVISMSAALVTCFKLRLSNNLLQDAKNFRDGQITFAGRLCQQ